MSLLAALTVTSVFTFNLRPADWGRRRDEQIEKGGEAGKEGRKEGREGGGRARGTRGCRDVGTCAVAATSAGSCFPSMQRVLPVKKRACGGAGGFPAEPNQTCDDTGLMDD